MSTVRHRPGMYQKLIRSQLFRMDAEKAYHFAEHALGFSPIWRALSSFIRYESPNLRTAIAGIPIENPVGLAAGFDKDCKSLPALSSLGFGYVTCGTVTLEPREGNPKPRLFRDTSQESLLNSMGFPNEGLEKAASRIERHRRKLSRGSYSRPPIVVSISGTEIDHILTCHRRLEPMVDAVEINISSPNTKGLRMFHDPRMLESLLHKVNDTRSKPLFVKLPPFPSKDEDAEHNHRALSLGKVCVSNQVAALTVANTLPVNDTRLEVGSGGLSGKPIYERMLQMVSEMRRHIGNETSINACGGIFSAEDAWRALQAGADTVQILTGFVYMGPRVARHINMGLADRISETAGVHSICDLATRDLATANPSIDGRLIDA